jgi:hypothetical protein
MIKESSYNKIFNPETIKNLKGKSGESLKKLLGNKSLMQTMVRSTTLLPEIVRAESGYHDELEMVAVQICKDAFPVIDYAGIEIDAKIVGMGNINLDNHGGIEDEDNSLKHMPESLKRRVINGITQGASVRGAYAFMIFREYIDDIDPSLIEKYKEILNLSFGIFDDENAIALMLSMLSQGQKTEGGSAEAEYDEENNVLMIKARALCFPMLVHEIVKGLYEIVSLQGFGGDKEKNKQIVKHIDRLENEPDDTRYGKFIYDSLNDLFFESNIEDTRVRELFLAELYKLDDQDFLVFIENLINNKLSVSQKKWALDEMKDIEKDLMKDDTKLSGL